MQGQRVLVIGCCGGGKTTLALRLAEITGLPVVHLDKLFWLPGWTQRTREEFYPLVQSALEKPAWIMEGNYRGSLPLRLTYCDMVICLDYPRRVCMWGVISRMLKFYGSTRPDLAEGCPERFDWTFLKYTWNFNKEQDAEIKALIRSSGKNIVWLRSRKEAERYLMTVQAEAAAGR